jgi:site-specific recombinase XerD
MPRPRPPHLHRETTRHGNLVWYVRIGKGPRTRIKAAYGSPEFEAAYNAAINGERILRPGARASAHSLQWLWDSYRQTENWLRLSPTTRYQRENMMAHALKESGTAPFAAITKAHVLAGLDRRATTPAAARNWLKTMKGFFQWAAEREHVANDPTATVKYPKPRNGRGFAPWTRDDVEAYHKRWPLGTRQRVWLDAILYTGLRRGDVHRVGRQHARNGVISLRTEKAGETIAVTLPILPVLQRTLDAGPIGDLAWCCGERGGPFTKESFGNAFAEAARIAGVKKSAHGVRKIAATIAAENGATAHQLMAIFGWLNINEAEHYTREVERARLAAQAMSTLDETGTSIPAPSDNVRAPGRKQEKDQR